MPLEFLVHEADWPWAMTELVHDPLISFATSFDEEWSPNFPGRVTRGAAVFKTMIDRVCFAQISEISGEKC